MAISEQVKEKILADYHTGAFSQRELVEKYNVGKGTISRLLKDLDPENGALISQLVDTTIKKNELLGQVGAQSGAKQEAVKNVVNAQTKHLEFINNITLKNLSSMAKKINEDTSIAEHKMISETADKSAITLGVAQRHATTTIATQVNTVEDKEVVFKRLNSATS